MAKVKIVKEVEEVIEGEEVKGSVYEVGYIIVPTVSEENLGGEVTAFKDALGEMGAVFVSDEYPKMMELAYEMSRSIANKKQKFSYGYFGWVKFECSTVKARIIKEFLDRNEKFVRYLMIRTVRESTMSSKHSYNKQESTRRHTISNSKNEEAGQINEEVIDKEIDALVV